MHEYDDTEYVIYDKISAIKLVRAFTGLGLKDSKIAVERWMVAFDYTSDDMRCNNAFHIRALGALARGLKDGQFVISTINEHYEIVISRPVTDEDIHNVR
jgi:hypothetical protein